MRAKEIAGRLLRKRWIPVALLTLLALSTAVTADYLYYRNRVYPGVYLNEIRLGGMKLGAVEPHLEKFLWTDHEVRFMMPDGGIITVPNAFLGIEWDREATLRNITAAGRGGSGYGDRVRYIFGKKRIQAAPVLLLNQQRLVALLEGFSSEIYREPRDAFFLVDGETASIVSEQEGRSLDPIQVSERIMEAVLTNKFEIVVPVAGLSPEVTKRDLEILDVSQVMISFHTDIAAGDANRVHNIDLGSRAINGYLLGPGEIFSFSETVGRATRERGYREAPVIVGDELVPGVGGGLCQVSSTLYNAALLANLEIVERHNHSLTVAYLPLGRDAAVADGHLDLIFRNDTGKYLLIGAELADMRLTFRIFGPSMEERVELVSSDLSTVEPPEIYRETDDLPVGVTELQQVGKPGYHVTTWRVVYQGESELSREIVSRDYYRPTPTVYLVGSGRSNNRSR